ncbi:MAG: ATP-dependent DNA helicase [bacterium]|nr:ATP-dependent DNA helicase [bacterium]
MDRIGRIFGKGGVLPESFGQYEIRPGQIEMSKAIYSSILRRNHLVIEAGTGVGKTLAYLVPLSMDSKLSAIISTGTRALQEQLFFKDIPYVRSAIRQGLRAVYIKGRSNYLCLRRLEDSRQNALFDSRAEIQEFKKVDRWSSFTTTGDVSELQVGESSRVWKSICCVADSCRGRKCSFNDTCFLMSVRREAASANIIVVNHHLFFSNVSLDPNGGGGVLPIVDVIVFDEAHMLESIATSFFGESVSRKNIEGIATMASSLVNTPAVPKSLREEITGASRALYGDSQMFFKSMPKLSGKVDLTDMSGSLDLLRDRSRFLVDSLDNLSNKCSFSLLDDLALVSRKSDRFADSISSILGMKDTNRFVYWVESRPDSFTLHSSPVDISSKMRSIVFSRGSSCILTSATLSVEGNFSFFSNRIGLGREEGITVSSPYNFREQGQMYIPRNMPNPNTEDFKARAALEVYNILLRTKGRAFVLFTSFRNLDYVYKYVSSKGLPYRLFKQGDMVRSEMLSTFRRDIHSVLFATDTFRQGVDVKGKALSCVIVDKLPFPVPTDPIIKARMAYCKNIRHRNPFSNYVLPSAAISLKQAVGRLIRSMSDTGVVCILDGRILSNGYGKTFIGSLPAFPIVRDIDDITIL